MKKILLSSFLLIFTLSLSACSSTRNDDSETNQDEKSNQAQNSNESINEEIKTQNSNNTIINIKENEEINSPVTITGTTEARKNELIVELRDIKHNSKVRAYALVDEIENEANPFKVTLSFIFSSTSEGFIAVYELDDKGQEKNLVEIPVKFLTQ